MLGLGGGTTPGEEALWALVEVPNLYVKITPLLMAHTAARGGDLHKGIRDLVEHFTPSRLVWGSNYTATALPSYRALVDAARASFAAFGDVIAQQIQFDTAAKLWWP
jgi:predicted TIM-barrel fold metal-dependent hydrolase